MSDNKLELWRLVSDLSVEDASILIAGGDPSAVDFEDSVFEQQQHPVKRTYGHPGFLAVFTSLTNAIRKGQLAAHLALRTDPGGPFSTRLQLDTWILTRADLQRLRDVLENDPFLDLSLDGAEEIQIQVDPDWTRTTVDVEKLKAWLRSRGYTSGFFFPAKIESSEDFMDKAHEHFAPELALAVSAWRAFADEKRFQRGAKAAIESWIEANPNAWKGEETLSTSAKERISVLVNWQRTGGAPKSWQ